MTLPEFLYTYRAEYLILTLFPFNILWRKKKEIQYDVPTSVRWRWFWLWVYARVTGAKNLTDIYSRNGVARRVQIIMLKMGVEWLWMGQTINIKFHGINAKLSSNCNCHFRWNVKCILMCGWWEAFRWQTMAPKQHTHTPKILHTRIVEQSVHCDNGRHKVTGYRVYIRMVVVVVVDLRSTVYRTINKKYIYRVSVALVTV